MLSSQEESEWFGAEYYDAEMPSSVKFGFGLGAGMALFQVVVNCFSSWTWNVNEKRIINY